MKPLKKKFRKMGSDFEQIKRDGKKAIYKRMVDGVSVPSYEVIRIRDGKEYEIAGVKFPAAELYPCNTEWGHYGWTYADIKSAEKRYEKI